MATPNEKIKLKNTAQCRALSLTAPADGASKRFDVDQYVEGYAAGFNKYLLYDRGDWGKVYERFDPNCFRDCDISDVILQYDHAGRVFARTTNNTLIVEPNEHGLFMAADLSRTSLAQDLHADIAAGMITKMSWRFMPDKYYVERQEGSRDCTIVHTRVSKIYDVSAVSIPANNEGTEISARSFVDGVIAELARSEAEEAERRRKVQIKCKIGGIKNDHC